MPSRSVVLAGGPRCARCRHAPRWCICAAEQAIVLPLAVDVLFHFREWHKPTSTGRLINRVVPASRGHVFRPNETPKAAEIVLPGCELWVLHPLGTPLEAVPRTGTPQVLLLDGSWREAAPMMRHVQGWGRVVSLPMTGPSRYRLRAQQGVGNYSTVEALLFLLAALGLAAAEVALRAQFELHVYAGLRGRGDKPAAEAFIAESPARDAFPAFLAELNRRRPRLDVGRQA
jgi:DTW domain-containing protein YfiP